MRCPICGIRAPDVGILCEECRDELSSPLRISPEQIQLRVEHPTDAGLIDLWGRVHRLEPRTLVGRLIENFGLAILEPSVSRHHAHLTLDDGQWTLRDLGSANGTFLDDKMIEAPIALASGARIRFGHIGFYLIENVAELPPPKFARTVTTTIGPLQQAQRAAIGTRPPEVTPAGAGVTNGNGASNGHSEPDPAGAVSRAPTPGSNPPVITARVRLADATDFEDDEPTGVGLPEIEFRLHEPTGGGGGVVEVNGKQVQLTTTQFELMALMIKRMAAESHQPELVRGFVRSSELIADLSWDTHEPSENHVKQLVRRVRRALLKSEIGDLIESRHRFGYRLRAIPKLE